MDNIEPNVRLSGAFVSYQEVLVWAQTRDAVMASTLKDAEELRIDIEMAVDKVTGTRRRFIRKNKAQEQLLTALRHGTVVARGLRGTVSGPSEALSNIIDASAWSNLCIGATHVSPERSIAKPAQGRSGSGAWYDLLFCAAGVLSLFPPDTTTAILSGSHGIEVAPAKRRRAGRPSNEPIWGAEGRAWIDAGKFMSSQMEFSKALAAWFAEAHPDKKRVTAKTIRLSALRRYRSEAASQAATA